MTLNESPSEKEGKFALKQPVQTRHAPSMKVPPKRKGNESWTKQPRNLWRPQ